MNIRMARKSDTTDLYALAALDSQAWEPGDALVAEVDGALWAALPFDGRAAVADPFRPSADLVDLLEMRKRQIDAANEASAVNSARRAGRRLRRYLVRA